MDPLSQGIVGSVAAQQKSSKEKILLITIIGFLSGMAPDLDVFIRSSHDPLLAIEFQTIYSFSYFYTFWRIHMWDIFLPCFDQK